ncbi:MAG: LysM peptidoglycan-binding domain-containing protein [Termitinemataceae bacterium]|nr:MAG: LysM peptidoglycan-binding domain-containing protein [Termitinemataceae bacterium]
MRNYFFAAVITAFLIASYALYADDLMELPTPSGGFSISGINENTAEINVAPDLDVNVLPPLEPEPMLVFDRSLRQNKMPLPERLIAAAQDRKRDIVLPSIDGLDHELTLHFIELYTKPQGLKWLSGVLKDGEPYLDFIRQEIAVRGMPPELLYLPVIESGFKATARSSSGAAGFWQFMRNSIKPYMVIDDWVDERLDFWKATHAALSKLQNNFKDYDDWALALAAYNSGSGAINSLLKQTGIHDYWKLADQKKLKRESIYYVPKLIAIYYIASNPRKFGLNISQAPTEHSWSRLSINKQINLSMLAEYAGIDYAELSKANSELKHNLTPPNEYLLKVKTEQIDAVQSVLNSDDIKLLKYYTYTIKPGDTLSALSVHYGVGVDQILAQNPGVRANALKLGASLIIPAYKEVGPYVFAKQNPPSAPQAPESTTAPLQNYTYLGEWVVAKGDTLWSIARAHNVSTDILAAANNININSTLSIGQKLKIPTVNKGHL